MTQIIVLNSSHGTWFNFPVFRIISKDIVVVIISQRKLWMTLYSYFITIVSSSRLAERHMSRFIVSNQYLYSEFEILTVVVMSVAIVRHVATCSMIVPHSADFRPWRWRWYISPKRRFTMDYTALYARRWQHSIFIFVAATLGFYQENMWADSSNNLNIIPVWLLSLGYELTWSGTLG
jgi:hypothetical protein